MPRYIVDRFGHRVFVGEWPSTQGMARLRRHYKRAHPAAFRAGIRKGARRRARQKLNPGKNPMRGILR